MAQVVPSRVMMVTPSSSVAAQEGTRTATISSDLQQESKAEVVEMVDMDLIAKQPADPYPNLANSLGENDISLSFHDICYDVPQRKCFVRKPNKIILKSVRLVCPCARVHMSAIT